MIRGTVIDLRPIRESDLDQLEAWANDEDFRSEYNCFGLNSTGRVRRAYAEHGYLGDDDGRLLVVTKEGEVAGDVSYRRLRHGGGASNRVYDLGISLVPVHRGKGYGSEAQRLLAAYLFATYTIERVEASTDVANLPEQRALERAGFTREGVLRRAQYRNGAWHDLVIYSKLRGE